MKIRKAFKYRLYPNENQKAQLGIQFGHSRFVYNRSLALRKEHYQKTGKGLNYYDLANELKYLKQADDTQWLKQADSQVLQQKIKDLDRAYINFFEGRAGYPTFKHKNSNQSIRYPQRFKLDGNKIYLPKIGWVKMVYHRPIEGDMKNVTVSKTKSGKYFVSIQCEVEIDEPVYSGGEVGIDLGLIDFATLSNSSKVPNNRHFRKSEKKLARAQRKLSKMKRGSNNYIKQKQKVARIHETIANQRRDFHHKVSSELVAEFSLIKFENLHIKGMLKNHKLAKSISDAAWGQFVNFVQYKGEWYGCFVEKIDRFYASSKTCSECGHKNVDLALVDRSWVCSECGSIHDRDINAAINILNF